MEGEGGDFTLRFEAKQAGLFPGLTLHTQGMTVPM